MNNGWAADFSYDYYRLLLTETQQIFTFHTVGDATTALSHDGKRHLILRHDVDVDLLRAVALAEVEQALAVKSTYMVMLNSPFYDPNGSNERALLGRLLAMGHEVSLHFDFDDQSEKNENARVEDTIQRITVACERLEEITGQPVRSVSFHKPLPQFLRGPLYVGNRVNAYARLLMEWYLSDSKGIWREGEPLIRIGGSSQSVLQLLTHPIWWGSVHRTASERLQAFSDARKEHGLKEEPETLDDLLFRHIGLMAYDLAED